MLCATVAMLIAKHASSFLFLTEWYLSVFLYNTCTYLMKRELKQYSVNIFWISIGITGKGYFQNQLYLRGRYPLLMQTPICHFTITWRLIWWTITVPITGLLFYNNSNTIQSLFINGWPWSNPIPVSAIPKHSRTSRLLSDKCFFSYGKQYIATR